MPNSCPRLVLAAVVLSLSACGGGSSDSGSPAPASASISATQITMSAVQGENAPIGTAIITVQNPPDDGLYAAMGWTGNGVSSVDIFSLNETTARLEVYFRSPDSLSPGDYQDEVQVSICYNESCSRQVIGSPLQVATAYTVTPADNQPDPDPDPDVPALSVLDRMELSHDVVDAEYSAALDAIVMVSSRPNSALHVHYPQTGAHHSVPLNRPPTSVSVSPDGLSAAVGHDAMISYIELEALGDVAPPPPVLLNVSTHVIDLVLDGRGHVHAIPLADQWVTFHSVEIATNTERLGSWLLRADSRGRLHPSGDYIYTANRGLSPDDIDKWDIRSGTAERLYDSPYHGTYPMCGDVWPSEDGAILYTACGTTLRASTDQASDMTYTGTLELSFVPYARIQSLSQSAESREIMLLETDWLACMPSGQPADCHMRLAIYESDFLNRSDLFSVPPIDVGDQAYAQRGLFVFHSANGAHRYMISRLSGVPAETHYLSVLQ